MTTPDTCPTCGASVRVVGDVTMHYEPVDGWVPVKTKPTFDGMCLVYAPSADPDKPLITCAWWDLENKSWSLINTYWAKAITHWMPLPAPPKGAKT